MKAVFENRHHLTEESLNMPFMIEESPVGIITEVNEETFTVHIFDRNIGVEVLDDKICAVYLSQKEQITSEKFNCLRNKSK